MPAQVSISSLIMCGAFLHISPTDFVNGLNEKKNAGQQSRAGLSPYSLEFAEIVAMILFVVNYFVL